MRVLLDENLPVELADHLKNHEVQTVAQAGWLQFQNGRLLSEAEEKFDVMLTMDKGIAFQHDHRERKLRIAVIIAVNSRISSLESLVPNMDRFVSHPDLGKLAWISAEGIEPCAFGH